MSSNKKYFSIFDKGNWTKLEKDLADAKEPPTFLASSSSAQALSKSSRMHFDEVVKKYPSEMNVVPYNNLIERLQTIWEVTNPPERQIQKKKTQIK